MGGEGDGGEGRERREGGRKEREGRRERKGRKERERKVRGKGVHYFHQSYTSTPTQKCSRNKIYE